MQVENRIDVSAFDLFPDIFAQPPEPESGKSAERVEIAVEFDGIPSNGPIRHVPGKSFRNMPQPPDVSWLQEGFGRVDEDTDADLQHCLVVISGIEKREQVLSSILSLDFSVHVAENGARAIEMLKKSEYSLLICDEVDAMPALHDYVIRLPMVTRRIMYYTLIGPALHTLYNLEALSLSANMVVSDRDVHHLGKILSRGFCDYEKLYRPFLDELQWKSHPFV
jgi:hypothetical protein